MYKKICLRLSFLLPFILGVFVYSAPEKRTEKEKLRYTEEKDDQPINQVQLIGTLKKKGLSQTKANTQTQLFYTGNQYISPENLLEKYKHTPKNRLLIIADSFRNKGNDASALVCYSLIYDEPEKKNDHAFLRMVCISLNKAGAIYYHHCDYTNSLQLFLKALDIACSIDYKEYISKIYNNIGGIYYSFKDYKTAKKYYELSYNNSDNAYTSCVVLNNIGMLSFDNRHYVNALTTYKKVCHIIQKEHIDTIYNESLNNIGNVYLTLEKRDSALIYFHQALYSARKFGEESRQAPILSNIGRLFISIQNYDSAKIYLKRSMDIAQKYNILDVLSDNYLAFSRIEEQQKNSQAALIYYKKYSVIRDSLYTSSQYAKMNELLFGYDMDKINRRIQKLNMEQEIKERTIVMQRLFQVVLGLLLCVVASFLFILYKKNRTLYRAYDTLVLKNKEILKSDKLNYQYKLMYEKTLNEKELIIDQLQKRLEDNSIDQTIIPGNECVSSVVRTVIESKLDTRKVEPEKSGQEKNPINEEMRQKLEIKILAVMNDRKVFCDQDFSLTKLSELLDSNSSYISWIINNSFNKNFNVFVNEYRVKEACRLLADSEYSKYSIESISSMVGFKHKSSFNPVFKEVTGVTPSFYIRSLKSDI